MMLRSKIYWHILLIFTAFVVVPICRAQTATTHSEIRPVVTAVFAPPANPADWSRYKYLDECQHTVARMSDSVAWGDRSDTLRYQITDTLPTVVVKTAQRCLEQFPIASVQPFQFPILLDLAIQSNDETMIRAVVSAQLSSLATAPVWTQAAILARAVERLLDARPVRMQLATEFASQADRFGDDALHARTDIMVAFRRLSAYRVDLDSEIAQTRGSLEKYKKIPPHTMSEVDRQLLLSVTIPGEEMHLSWIQYLRNHKEEDFSQYVKIFRQLENGTLIGQPAPPLAGDFWFNTADQEARSVVVPGRLSLVVFISTRAMDANDHYGYGWLRRIHEHFPDVRIFLVSAVNGFFRDLPLPLPAAQEANLIHQYLTDSLKLPGTISVSTVSYEKHFTGRLLPLPLANESAYATVIRTSNQHAFLIDQKGRIVRKINLQGRANLQGAAAENMLTATIASLLKQTVPVQVPVQPPEHYLNDTSSRSSP